MMAISRRLRFEILRRDGHTCRYCGAMAPDAPLTVDHVLPVALGGTDEPNNLVTACGDCNGGKTSIAPGSPLVADVAADALRWKRAIEQAAQEFAMERDFIDACLDRFLEAWNNWTYSERIKVAPEPLNTGDPLHDHWHELLGYTGYHCKPGLLLDGTLVVLCEKGYMRDTKTALAGAMPRITELVGPITELMVEYAKKVNPPPRPEWTYRWEKRRLPLDDNWRESVTRFLSLGLTMGDFSRFIELAMHKSGLPRSDVFRYFCGCCWRHITDLQESARRILESEDAAE